MTLVRSVAVRFVIYPAIVYVLVGLYFAVFQAQFVFPAPEFNARIKPGLPFEDLKIPVNSTDHLHGWWIPAAASSRKCILVLHGNGEVIEDLVGEEINTLHALGANLLLLDYRGYGTSSHVTPNESTVDADARAALDELLKRRKAPIGDVIILGRSLGSGPATQLASEHADLGGLILESAFTSIVDVVNPYWYFRIFPIGILLRTHFDNASRIGAVRVPVLIVDGTADTLTPVWMAEKLLAKANGPKQIYLVPGAGHEESMSVGGKKLAEVLRRFIWRTNRY